MRLLSGIHSTYIIICVSYIYINITQRVRVYISICIYIFTRLLYVKWEKRIFATILSVGCSVYLLQFGLIAMDLYVHLAHCQEHTGGAHRKDNDTPIHSIEATIRQHLHTNTHMRHTLRTINKSESENIFIPSRVCHSTRHNFFRLKLHN